MTMNPSMIQAGGGQPGMRYLSRGPSRPPGMRPVPDIPSPPTGGGQMDMPYNPQPPTPPGMRSIPEVPPIPSGGGQMDMPYNPSPPTPPGMSWMGGQSGGGVSWNPTPPTGSISTPWDLPQDRINPPMAPTPVDASGYLGDEYYRQNQQTAYTDPVTGAATWEHTPWSGTRPDTDTGNRTADEIYGASGGAMSFPVSRMHRPGTSTRGAAGRRTQRQTTLRRSRLGGGGGGMGFGPMPGMGGGMGGGMGLGPMPHFPPTITGPLTRSGELIAPEGTKATRLQSPSARDTVMENMKIKELRERAKGGDEQAMQQLIEAMGGRPTGHMRPGQPGYHPHPHVPYAPPTAGNEPGMRYLY